MQPIWALGKKDRELLVTNEVMGEEIIKVLGEECRKRGVGNTNSWGVGGERKGFVRETEKKTKAICQE